MSRTEKSGKSPYQRYDKAEYQYQHKRCSHSNAVRQSLVTQDRSGNKVEWIGKVCSVCNIVLDGPYL